MEAHEMGGMQEKKISKPINLTFLQTAGFHPLKKLKKLFYEKTMRTCQEAGFDKDSYPMFKDVVMVEGRPTLRLESEEHIHFFNRILNDINV